MYIHFLLYNFVPFTQYINPCSHLSHLHGNYSCFQCVFVLFCDIKRTYSHDYFLSYKFLLINTYSCHHLSHPYGNRMFPLCVIFIHIIYLFLDFSFNFEYSWGYS